MNRNSIIEELGRLADAKGYSFYVAEDAFIPQSVKSYPAMWLLPPKFLSQEGRKSGKITYSITLQALYQGAKLPPERREEVRRGLENDLVEIFFSLSQYDCVIEVGKLSISHSSLAVIPYGDLVAKATAEVVTFF